MKTLTEREISDWFTTRIAAILDTETSAVAPDTLFFELGLSSVQAIELLGDLETWCGKEVSPTFVYDYPTIKLAARYVAELT